MAINKQEETAELGESGLKRTNRVGIGQVAEEFIIDLKHQKAKKVYREMADNDPVIGGFLFAIDMLIRNVEWSVQPKSDEPQDIEAAEFIEEARTQMIIPWEELISEILSMLIFGFSIHEPVFVRREDGKIIWLKIPIRAQETILDWKFDDKGTAIEAKQQTINSSVPVWLPMEKMLLFRPKAHKNNPEGRSILRNAYRPWFFKKRIEEIEGIGIERDLAGLPVIYAPVSIMKTAAVAADAAIFAELKNIVRNIRRDEQEGIIMPGDKDEKGNRKYELELLSSGGQRQFDTNAIVARYDNRIAMTVLADFLMLGQGKTGSFALASSKTKLFATALGAWLKNISGVFNTNAIPQLLRLNGMPGEALLSHGDIESPDLEELGKFVTAMTGAGIMLSGDEDAENFLRGAAGMPKIPEGALDEDSDLDDLDGAGNPEDGNGGQPMFPEEMTVNEKRGIDGLESIEGGDAIYKPASEIPAIEIEKE